MFYTHLCEKKLSFNKYKSVTKNFHTEISQRNSMIDLNYWKDLLGNAFEIFENLDGNTVIVSGLFAVGVMTITWKFYEPSDHFALKRKQKHLSTKIEIEKALSQVSTTFFY